MSDRKPAFCFHSQRPEETFAAARALGGGLDGEAVVLSLIGELGAGKTQFVKGLAEGLGLEARTVTSPTFAIVNEYVGSGEVRLVHMDFYRLESEIALEEVGFIDLLEMNAVLAIEWGDRFPNALPTDHVELRIERPGSYAEETLGFTRPLRENRNLEECRDIYATPTGPSAAEIVERWSRLSENLGD